MYRKITISWLVISLSLLVACGGGGSGAAQATAATPTAYTYRIPSDRGDSWSVGNAADHGMDPGVLENMVNAVGSGQFDFIDSVVIAKNGVLIFDETIRTTTDAEDRLVANTDLSMHRQFSASKSIMSLVVGIAIDDGFIPNVSVPYLKLFPYPGYANWDARKDDITLEHVLAMRLGLTWDEWDPPYTSSQNQLIRFYNDNVDFAKGLLDLPLAEKPGTSFAYNTVATITLGQAVENAVPMTLLDFSVNELLLPLGIVDLEFLSTPTGLPNTGSSLYFRTRDMAKFGQLALNGGLWNGQRIVSEEWIDASMTPLSTLTWSNPEEWDWQIDGYGYQWWVGHYDFDGGKLQTYVAWGFGGQWIVAIPALDLVVAVNSHGYEGEDEATNQGHALIKRFVLEAIRD